MAKFLVQGTYSVEGTQGLIKEGGSGRKTAVKAAIKGLGGKLESMYYTADSADVVVICDMPDVITGLALTLAVNASGAVQIAITELLTVEEVDEACKKTVKYRPAGE
jgi:uncharacterized protein with GYD domain